MALNIDAPGDDGLFGMRNIKTSGYSGAVMDARLDLLGFDVEVLDEATLRFYLINQRPPVHYTNGTPTYHLNATQLGANQTIDVFDLKRGEDSMVHVKTVFDSAVYLPNKVAHMGDGSFVVTNDHSVQGKFSIRED